jgi:NAD(P)-dependent dehydrogenase (short-subunit alcohol dehydrogenase family)
MSTSEREPGLEDLIGLSGKNVVVVGGGQGMGESTSMILAAIGCNVAVLDIDQGRADFVASNVRDLGVTAIGVPCDVMSVDSLLTGMTAAEEALGSLDALVCIVGMSTWAPLLELSESDWDRDLRRNLGYIFSASRWFAQTLVRRKTPGSIVCITSVDGIRSAAYHASYGAAKAGVINLVKTMAAEWSEHGIRVNAIAPGTIVTPRFPLRDAAAEAAQTGLIPAHRRGTVDEIAKVVLFLISDLASYVTGQTLAVDGGYTSIGPQDYSALYRDLGRK